MPFAKNMGNFVGIDITRNLSSIYSQKLFDYAKQSATDVLKTVSEKASQNAVEATGYLIDNEIANKIIKALKRSTNNVLGTDKSETEIPKERYISPKRRQQVITKLRVI